MYLPILPQGQDKKIGYPAEVGALFTTVSSIRVSRVGRVSVMVSVRDSVK